MRFSAAVLTAFIFTFSAAAAEKAGEVKSLEGKVELIKQEQVMGKPAKAGSPLMSDELLRTKRRASAEVVFVDGSTAKVGESSRLIVKGLDRNKGENAHLQKGSVLFDIAKNDSATGDFTIKTGTSIIGVKGTVFAGQVDKDGRTTVILPKDDANKESSLTITSASGEQTRLRMGKLVNISPDGAMRIAGFAGTVAELQQAIAMGGNIDGGAGNSQSQDSSSALSSASSEGTALLTMPDLGVMGIDKVRIDIDVELED
jgi:hypothetical protein